MPQREALCPHTCQLSANFMGERARKWPFSTDFLSKAARAAKVMTISMGEIHLEILYDFKESLKNSTQSKEMLLK